MNKNHPVDEYDDIPTLTDVVSRPSQAVDTSNPISNKAKSEGRKHPLDEATVTPSKLEQQIAAKLEQHIAQFSKEIAAKIVAELDLPKQKP